MTRRYIRGVSEEGLASCAASGMAPDGIPLSEVSATAGRSNRGRRCPLYALHQEIPIPRSQT